MIFLLIKRLYKTSPIFVWAISFFVSLYFVNSNLSFFAVALFFFMVLYIATLSFSQAAFLTFVATLPLPRGKTFDFVIIPSGQIPIVGLFDIGYYFPLYPSVVFLVVLLYLCLRMTVNRSKNVYIPGEFYAYIAFIIISIIPVAYSPFPFVIGLSVVQLFMVGGVYFLPLFFRITDSVRRNVSRVLAAFTLFETAWVVSQVFHQGPLGKYIEAILPLNRSGILSTEDSGYMRFNGTFHEPSILGTFMLMHFFYFVLLVMQKVYKSQTEKILYLVAAICALISIVFTGSRGVYILLALFSFFLFRRHIQIKMNAVFFVTAAILVGLSSYFFKRTQTIPKLFIDLLAGQGSGSFRVQLDDFAYRVGLNHLFGTGLNLSPYYFALGFPGERTVEPAHPHNLFFQILAETGFPGLLAFLLFLWFVFRNFVHKPTRRATPYFFAAVLFILSAQFYPIFISQPEILSFFFLHAGLMNSFFEKKRQ